MSVRTRSLQAAFALPILALVFAGCISDAPADPAERRVKAEYGDDTGAVEGFILDESELPIVGAMVGIPQVSPDLAAQSDAEGRFTLSNVAPGDYVIHATALGYVPGQAKATVTAGAVTTDIEIQLIPAATDRPYSTTDIRKVSVSGLMWKLTPTCIYTDNPLIKTCSGVRLECKPSDNDCEVHYGSAKDFTDEWATIIGEVMWQQQSGATGKGFNYNVVAPNVTRDPSSGAIAGNDPHSFKVSSNEPPIRIQVDEAALTARGVPESDWQNSKKCESGNCDWFWRIFPAPYDLGIGEQGLGPDYGLMYQNPVEIYFTYFVKAPAPEGFTALPPA